MRPNLLPRLPAVWLLATSTLFTVLSARSAEAGANASTPYKGRPQYVCPADPDGPVYETPGFCGHDERIEQGRTLRVAVVLFKGAQIIDYAGPMEIFGQAGATVFTVAPTKEARTSIFGLNVNPDYDFETAPPADVLLVPGGNIEEIVQSPGQQGLAGEARPAVRDRHVHLHWPFHPGLRPGCWTACRPRPSRRRSST